MTRGEILAHNAGVAAVVALAAAAAEALQGRLVIKPTRYAFAIAALEGVVEAAASLVLPLDGDGGSEPDLPVPPPAGPAAPSSSAIIVAA